MSQIITSTQFEKFENEQIFAQGEIVDSPEGINIMNTGKMLKWVAVKGGIEDWTVYCHFAENSFDYVARCGDKVYDEANIKKVVTCEIEVFQKYRY